MRPDVLHSWARSREHQIGKVPSAFISEGVRGAAVPLQRFPGFPWGSGLPGATAVPIEIGAFTVGKLVVCSAGEPCRVAGAENGLWKGHLKGRKKAPLVFFSTGGKYFCLCRNWRFTCKEPSQLFRVIIMSLLARFPPARPVAICEYQQYLNISVLKAKVSGVSCVFSEYHPQMGRSFVCLF